MTRLAGTCRQESGTEWWRASMNPPTPTLFITLALILSPANTVFLSLTAKCSQIRVPQGFSAPRPSLVIFFRLTHYRSGEQISLEIWDFGFFFFSLSSSMLCSKMDFFFRSLVLWVSAYLGLPPPSSPSLWPTLMQALWARRYGMWVLSWSSLPFERSHRLDSSHSFRDSFFPLQQMERNLIPFTHPNPGWWLPLVLTSHGFMFCIFVLTLLGPRLLSFGLFCGYPRW